MNELINVKNENGQSVVSPKELYLGLGLAKDQWSRWYKANIVNSEFFHIGIDFIGVRHNVEGNESMDFAISLEFAKHIAMMARTVKSHEYRNYFLNCEKQLLEQKPTCIEDVLIKSLQEMKDIKQQLNQVNHSVLQASAKAEETKGEVQAMRDIITLNPNSWRKDSSALINKMALNAGGYEHIRVCKSKRDKLTVLDVIADDKKLIEGYLAIVKEMSIKYKA